jgi:hypothetical protein
MCKETQDHTRPKYNNRRYRDHKRYQKHSENVKKVEFQPGKMISCGPEFYVFEEIIIKRLKGTEMSGLQLWFMISHEWYKGLRRNHKLARRGKPDITPVEGIDNSVLFSNPTTLKTDLERGTNYVAVNDKVWKFLRNRYGGSPVI